MISFLKWLGSVLGVIFLTLLVLALFIQNDDAESSKVNENKKKESTIETPSEN